ncbi:EF-hand domain-containing protein [Sphingomonas koreensis]|nr:EF-hand domain-containing protein [Sphingomonas koreensis]
MWRYLAGGLAALLLVTAGFFFFRGGAKPDEPLFAPAPAQTAGSPTPLPSSAPAASEKTREEKRFDRYDKDRNGQITREEYLASRRKAYAKLDLNHDGALSFDEWALKSETTFAKADGDRSGAMNAAEFLTTKVERKTTPKCACAPAKDDD